MTAGQRKTRDLEREWEVQESLFIVCRLGGGASDCRAGATWMLCPLQGREKAGGKRGRLSHQRSKVKCMTEEREKGEKTSERETQMPKALKSK